MLAQKKNGIAFFDLDGPLRGGSFTDWFQFLAEKGIIQKKTWEEIQTCLERFKKGKISYKTICFSVVNQYAKGLKGRTVEEVQKAAKEFVKKEKKLKLHKHTIPLIELMKRQGITILITGQPIEVAEEIAKKLGMDEAKGTELRAKNGKYTGRVRVNNAVGSGKIENLRNLFQKYKSYAKKSFAFGDRYEDRVMLRNTRNPVALNPDAELTALAEKLGWAIATNKNAIQAVKKEIEKAHQKIRKLNTRRKRRKAHKKMQKRIKLRRFK